MRKIKIISSFLSLYLDHKIQDTYLPKSDIIYIHLLLLLTTTTTTTTMPTRIPNYKPDYDISSFVSTPNHLGAIIIGRPLAWKRPGGRHFCIRYDQQKKVKQDFLRSIMLLHQVHGIDFIEFGERNVELHLVFNIKLQWEADLDNLVKFVMDCLQMPISIDGSTVRVYDNDICVTRIVAEKRYVVPGQPSSTVIKVLPVVVQL